MSGKKTERTPIYKLWWFWVIVVAIIAACVVAIVLALPKEKEKEYMSSDDLSAKIEKDRQAAIEQQKEATRNIVKATKEAVLAYKELKGYYPTELTDMEGWTESSAVTYNYDGVNTPTLSYYLDGEKVEEPIE